MKKRLMVVVLAVMVGVLGILGPTAPVWADSTKGTWNNCTDVVTGAKNEAMCDDITDSNKNISKTVRGIFDTVFGIAGVLGVIGVIYGGFVMMTAGGDPTKVKKGKDALLYSVIGLIVVALSWAIVSLVATQVLK